MKLNNKDFFESNPLPSWICEPKTYKVMDVNRSAVRTFGISRNHWLNNSIRDRVSGFKKSKKGVRVDVINSRGTAYPLLLFCSTIAKGKEELLLFVGHACSDGGVKLQSTREDNFRKAVTSATIVSIADKRGNIIYVNDNFVKISGYTLKELVGQSHRIINSGHHPQSFWIDMWHTIAAGTTWRGEVKNKTKQGGYYWVDTFIMPFIDEQGNVREYLSIRNDITSKKIAEEKLLKVAEQLSDAMEFAGMGILELNSKDDEVILSPELFELLEERDVRENNIPLQKFLDKYIVRDDHQVVEQNIYRGLNGHKPITKLVTQFSVLTAKGNIKIIEAFGTFYRDQRAIGIFQDVTLRKKAAEVAQIRAKQITGILNSITTGFYAVDRNFNFILANSVFEKLVGAESGTLIGKNLWNTFPTIRNSFIYEKFHDILNSGVHEHFEYHSEFYPGTIFEVHAYPNNDGLLIYYQDITKRKQQQDEVNRLAFIASHTSNTVVLINTAFEIVWVNKSFEQLTGHALEEVIGKSITSFLYHKETDPNTISIIDRSIKEATQLKIELFNYSRKGRKYWVDTEIIPMKNEGGVLTGFMVVQVNITALKTAVHEMLKSQELMQTILDKAPIMVFLKDLDGRYIFYNKFFSKYYQPKTKKFLTDYDLFSKEEADSFHASDQYVIETRNTLEVEQEINSTGNKEFYYTTKFPLLDNNKELYGVGGVSLRITDRKQAAYERKKLQEDQARLDKIVRETYNEIYLFAWDSLQFEFANSSALKNIGYSTSEFLSMKFSDLFNFPDEMALKALLSPLKRGETDRVELQIKHNRKDGTYYDVNTIIQVLEKNRTFVAIATDITHKLSIEKKLLATILEKETLIKEIHHRVKNNLQLISSIIYIKMASQTEPEMKYFLENTRQKIRSIALIHERLLQSEKLDKVEIADYLGKLISDLGTTNFREDLELDFKTEIEPFILSLDTAIYCGLIVNELITNAIKHAFKGRSEGYIKVSFSKEVKNYLLCVEDNGVTIPENITPGKSGSFGMHLLEIFVKQLNGAIEIIRENGTRFQVRFSSNP